MTAAPVAAELAPGVADSIRCADCAEALYELPRHCAKLVIADPPYFKTKGEFDFVWREREEYLADVEKWADAVGHVLADNGSLVWWCSYRMLGYVQVRLDERFTLLNSCTVRKMNGIQHNFASLKAKRRWLVNDERFLFYESQGGESCGESRQLLARNRLRCAEGYCHSRVMRPIIDYLNGERERAGWTVAAVQKAFGQSVPSHWFTRASQWELPTRANYERLRALLNGLGDEFLRKDYESLRQEYEGLRQEYEGLRRHFELTERQSDVWEIGVDSGLSARLKHATPKNWKLMRKLVETTTLPGDLVVVPFAGSGTECAVAAELGRHYVGYDVNPDYVELSRERVRAALGKNNKDVQTNG